ncbi:sodium:sulfate symporter transmembrane region [Necator americanus]|uniref:Sodium:sulfate symporter transmembrane region n=1 Tax=Necator americanus TaxID=51031 RepID=W2SH89_NECAM|nr:sodium:sulfate symporter transmembrane region [Necator americanus]ETN68908.1 sodium:sulfate symporter transmembrane region [Necator americanus]
MLIVAHASLIGGTGTINSTGPNLIFRDTLEKFYPGEDTGISYLSWMAFAIPPMVGYMFASWMIVQIQFLGFRHISRIFKPSTDEEKTDEEYVRKAVDTAYNDLGPITFAEKSTLVIFVLTVTSWITSDPKVVDGWATFFKNVIDRDRPSTKREALLTWDAVRRRFPWSVILLLGAGFAISKSVKESGLSTLIACNMQSILSGFPLFVMQAFINLITVVLTEFSTNSATASILIPIAFNIAESVRAHPLYFSIPAAIGPSFSFMLPMATPPNAIVYETGTMRMIDMLVAGFWRIFDVL